jgi:DUF2934 family protein
VSFMDKQSRGLTREDAYKYAASKRASGSSSFLAEGVLATGFQHTCNKGQKSCRIRNRELGTPDYRGVMNTPQNIPSHDAISNRAREIWESSGQIEGRDLENWLQAEKELLEAAGADSSNNRPSEKAEPAQPESDPTPRTTPTAWKRDPGNRDRATDVGRQARARP